MLVLNSLKIRTGTIKILDSLYFGLQFNICLYVISKSPIYDLGKYQLYFITLQQLSCP